MLSLIDNLLENSTVIAHLVVVGRGRLRGKRVFLGIYNLGLVSCNGSFSVTSAPSSSGGEEDSEFGGVYRGIHIVCCDGSLSFFVSPAKHSGT